ncbi:hypermethylated in cancer 1 protein-like [Paramormyrops kingsleyae]|uniref:Hypermethylated in cancer 1 protein n=1 Tax=Paramormyrops kingsleyae TaxID=1676925 RepID=A0A3B3R2E2_9TELE|nr:hypermethylated in cancer 1 protein-like [Paramormyrops kingsleyae]
MIIKGGIDRMAEESGRPGGGLKTMLDAMEAPSHARHLLLQLNTQRTKGFLCDVIIVVQNALFRAHKNILAASSLYLKSLVVHDNLINLDHEMVSPGVFRVILDYIYTGHLGEDEARSGSGTEPSLTAVLAAASYLQLLDLVALCRKKLKHNGKCHLLPTSDAAPYGRLSGTGRCRESTPVIQSCFPGGVTNSRVSRGHPPEELAGHPLVPQQGELYAPAPSSPSQQVYPGTPPGLQPQASMHTPRPERVPSPYFGLDLSKKSPESQSQQTPSHPVLSLTHLGAEANGGLGHAGRDSADMETEERVGSFSPKSSHPLLGQELLAHLPHLYRPHALGQEVYSILPGTGPDAPEDGEGLRGLYRWVKREPASYSMEDEEDEEEDEEEEEDDEDEDEEERGQEGARRRRRRKRGGEKLGVSGEDERSGSASEETGSSEGRPSPPETLERFRLACEPQSFGDNLYVCIPCDKGFPSSEQLNAHVEAHAEDVNGAEPPFGQPLAEPGHDEGEVNGPGEVSPVYPGGKRVPAGPGETVRPYRCTSCSKSYKDPATLRQHEKTHWLTRPYPCSICGKKFTQRGTMTRHMRSHLGLKPFACDACGMRFTRQYRLTEHMRIHSGEKPYECQVCGGRFAQQRNLISHMKMHGVAAAPPRADLSEAVHPLSRYAAERLGLTSDRAAELLSQASQRLLADTKASEGLYPLSKLAAQHLGLLHDKMEALRLPTLGPPAPTPAPEPRAIGRYSPS